MTAPHIGNTGVNDEDPESATDLGRRLRRARPRPPRLQLALAAQPRRRAARAGRRRHLRHRHPGADPPPARARRDAGRHLLDRDRPGRAARAGPRVRRDGRRRARRRGLDAGDLRRPGHRREAVHRRRARPRHQGDDAAPDGRARHRGARAARRPRPSTTSSRPAPTGSSSPTAPATRPPTTDQVELLQEALGQGLPYFGICFGNQLFGRALGFGTYKLKYGHRGINQPVMDRTTGKVEVTAHNHGFAVDAPLDGADHHAVRRGDGQPRLPQRRRGRGPRAAATRPGG